MKFSLIDEPWILAQRVNGEVTQVSLLDLVRYAHELRAIVGQPATQEFAILRLVLAVLHAATRGPTTDSWSDMWRCDRLPVDAVGAYLDRYRERFDLLHPRAPFYQVAGLQTAKDEVFGLERLIADVPTGPRLFTGRSGEALRQISFGEAARWLVHAQAFDVSGIKSGAVGDSRVKKGKGYPIGTGFAGSLGGVFADGDTVRETLLLNLVPKDLPYLRCGEQDRPVWELDPQGPQERDDGAPYGVLGLYTWQSRRIRLFGDGDGVTGVLVANGDRLAAQNLHGLEPLTAWQRNPAQKKASKLPTVYLPQTHRTGRSLWRGLASLLPGTAGRARHAGEPPGSLDPLVMEWIARAVNQRILTRRLVRLRAIGAVYRNKQSVIDEVIGDAITMPVRAIVDEDTAIAVKDAAQAADKAVGALTHLTVDVLKAAGVRDDKRVDGARAEAAAAGYGALDQAFRQWLTGLDDEADLGQASADWHTTARRILTRLGDRVVADAGPTAWVGRTVEDRVLSSAQADLRFRGALATVLNLADREGAVSR